MSTDTKLDFKYLASALLSRANELVPNWLPGGRVISNEYSCANIRGGAGKSFKVNMRSGKWADFAAGDKGGDLISLYAAINGLSQFDAARALAVDVGHRLPDPRDNIKPAPIGPIFVKPLKGTKLPDFKHIDFGEPTVRYTYRDESGDALFFVCRYDPADGKKQFIPFSYTSAGNWVRKMWPSPRPLFGLEQLPDGSPNILIVEGEKAAIAARIIVGSNYTVLTWHGGVNAIDKADWSPIYGKRILLWPDADAPGRTATLKLAGLLVDKVKSLKILNPPDDFVDGWDAADALAEGFVWDKFKAWAKPLVSLFELPAVTKSKSTALALIPEIVAPMPDEGDAPHDLNVSFYVGLDEAVLDQPVRESVSVIHARCGVSYTGGRNPQPIMNSDNVLKIFGGVDTFKDMFWFDEFHKKIFVRNGEVIEHSDDVHAIRLMTKLQRDYGFSRVSKAIVQDAFKEFAHSNIKNEAVDFVRSEPWDGVARIDRFLIDAFGSTDCEYSLAVSRNMWLSLAARIIWPGCKVDTMVILEGRQGIYKSTALMELAGKFFGKSAGMVGTKDFYISLQGKLIVEMGELASMSKVEVNTVKDMLSTPVDMFRLPYDKTDKPFPRTCIFVGTTNDYEYLHDVTGARRFWPIKVVQGDLSYIKKYRMQFFAEALARAEKGETWWQMPEGLAEIEQESRRVVDVWEEMIEQWLVGRNDVSMQDIGVLCLGIDVARFDRLAQNRIGRIMRALGWDKRQTKINNKNIKVWRKLSSMGYEVALSGDVFDSKKKTVLNHADKFHHNSTQIEM